ncbi:MAG TPA: F0F1 ATP synthase subunit delta, partial [Bacteroidales bacterium]|nr:F0F1 ATP synthase subunit delta [Bacteroidales bacterium]
RVFFPFQFHLFRASGVQLEWKEDPDLIGGFTLTLGMNEWDASLRTRLREVGKSYGLKEFY